MIWKLADNRDQRSVAAQLRRKRFAFFFSLLSRLERPVRILDIGGTEGYWNLMMPGETDQVFITLLNLSGQIVSRKNFTSVVGDARRLDFEDKSYDVVFSNSVIEHVGAQSDQDLMAKEARRVGKRYYVQTPNRRFPVEPHFLFPFFQYLPLELRSLLLQRVSLGWFPKTPDPARAREIVSGIRLLDKREFLRLFPDAGLYEEKFLGITKSFVAFGGWEE